MNKKSYFGDLMLFLAAFIWGTAFVAQIAGMDRIGPFTFNMARSIVAVISLGAYLIFIKAKLPKDMSWFLYLCRNLSTTNRSPIYNSRKNRVYNIILYFNSSFLNYDFFKT